ncbi:MAG: preprotein translocase subunit SecE [Alphaproteobacteria bacterium]|nr:preprotein translocase subunit SecE [Alphaproteobacteria bacterium]
MMSPAEFVSQVKRELQRVTWPSQKETVVMTVAVLVLTACMMFYFLASDAIICWALAKVLGI